VLTAEGSTSVALRSRLREVIAGARVGDRLPSERQLSARWGVARMTLRRAIDGLVAEGLVERRHGSGTYVVPQPFVRLLGLTSFTHDMRTRGMTPGSRLLAWEEGLAEPPIAERLGIRAGSRVCTFTRLRLANGEPMAVETVWIPAALVPGLSRDDLAGSLYELLATRYRIVPGAATVTIEPVLADEAAREALAIGPDQACLRLRMVDSDSRGRVIMVASCVYRGDRYQLHAEVSGAAFAPATTRLAG
jgi:GntR family transcriptional regulator